MCVLACRRVYVPLYMFAGEFVCVRVFMHVYACIYVSAGVFILVCICIYGDVLLVCVDVYVCVCRYL